MSRFLFSKMIAPMFGGKPAPAKARRVHGRRLSVEPLEQRAMLTVTFGAVTNVAVGTNPFSVTVGDFNGDGRPDLASANYSLSSNSVSVLLGNGDGTFPAATAATNFAVASRPRSVAVSDFNADGKPDLVTANFVGSNVSVLLGNGDGTFGLRTDIAVGSNPRSVSVADFNGDGKPDLATANRYSNNVSVLLGNGDGTFGPATNLNDFAATPLRPLTGTVGDFNGDGKPDLAIASIISPNSISVRLNATATNATTPAFGPATTSGVGTNPVSVTVGDFNGDGKADLATANVTSYDVSVLLGNGDGTFAAATNFGVGRRPQSVTVGDFNGDGKPDLATANNNSNSVTVLLGNGDGTFGLRTDRIVGVRPFSVTVGDFNGDGRPDLASANYASNNVSVLLNTTVPANTPPVVAADAAAVSANEGGTVSNTGTFSDAQGNNTVTAITATVGGVAFGTVTKNDANGTWSWSANAADGPAGPFTVTIRATDNQNAAANATFNYAVNNVPPTISLSGNADVNEGAPYTLNLGVVTDPGADTISQYIINWGDGTNSGLITGNPADTTATHTFADGPATQTNQVTVTDEDGAFLAGSLNVIVKNVAPAAMFTSNGPIIYGQIATVSFADQNDDSSADTTAGFHYAYSDTGDFTGITYASGSSIDATHDYTGLDAGDYTFYGRIIDKDDGYSEHVQYVTVNKADANVSVSGYGGTYDAASHGATGSATGLGGVDLVAGLDLGDSITNAPGGTAHWAFTGGTNYNDEEGDVAIDIAKAAISYTIGDAGQVYGSMVGLATALGTTFLTGVNGENLGIVYSSTGNASTANAGGYDITGVVSDDSGFASNYLVTLTPGTLTVTQAILTGDATTQDALNMAKQGKLTIAVSNVAGLLNGDTLTTFLSTAEYYITVGAVKYVFVPTTVTTSGSSITVTYGLKDPALLEELGTALDGASSGATAITAGFSMESLNYTFFDDYLTHLFSTAN